MSTLDSPEIVIIFGFLGGIVGGLIVNIISIKYQKRVDRKIEEEKSKIEYIKDLKALLNEIIESWEKELTKKQVDRQTIQNDFDIYSRQLTSLIARAPYDFSPEKLSKLRELSASLTKLKNFRISTGPFNYKDFLGEAEKIVNSAKEIRKTLN